MWVDTSDLPTSDGHPYFERLNRVLADSGFDAFVEELCAAFYADRLGRPSLRPGRYFRMLFIGYFEGSVVGAGDCVAGSRFAESAVVPGPGVDRGGAGPLDAVAHAAACRRGGPRGGLHVGVGAAVRVGSGLWEDGGHRRDDAGGDRGNAERRASGHGRIPRGLHSSVGGGVRDRDANRIFPFDSATARVYAKIAADRRRAGRPIGEARSLRSRACAALSSLRGTCETSRVEESRFSIPERPDDTRG